MSESRPTLMQSLARSANRAKNRGVAEVWQLAAQRAREGISSEDTLILFVRDSGDTVDPMEGLEFKKAGATDAVAYALDIATDSATTFRARLTERTDCYLVRDTSGRIVHASWVTTGTAWTRELRAYLRPPQGDAYIYESFTRPEVRGRGVYPYALRAICATAGVERLWVATEADNAASIRSVTKAGFEEAFRLAYRRRMGKLHIDPPTGERAQEAVTFVTRSP